MDTVFATVSPCGSSLLAGGSGHTDVVGARGMERCPYDAHPDLTVLDVLEERVVWVICARHQPLAQALGHAAHPERIDHIRDAMVYGSPWVRIEWAAPCRQPERHAPGCECGAL